MLDLEAFTLRFEQSRFAFYPYFEWSSLVHLLTIVRIDMLVLLHACYLASAVLSTFGVTGLKNNGC